MDTPLSEGPTVLNLINKHTLSVEMAATMWAFVSEQPSFISVAFPNLAGKTTVADAVLSMRPPAVQVHEIDRVDGGRPHGRLLHGWHEHDDTFEVVESPMTLQRGNGDIVARVAALSEVVESGRRSATDVAALVDGLRLGFDSQGAYHFQIDAYCTPL